MSAISPASIKLPTASTVPGAQSSLTKAPKPAQQTKTQNNQSEVAQNTNAQTLPMTAPMTGLASPYDGTTPTALGVMPGAGMYGAPTLTNPGFGNPYGAGVGAGPQLNATNQTAFAQGDVNQHVVNENNYSNKYYNIIVPNSGLGGLGGFGMLGGLFGSWNSPGNSFIDPQTGVLYVQKDSGITGWFKRLFRN